MHVVRFERHTERGYTVLLIVQCLLSQQLNACSKHTTRTITLFMMVTALCSTVCPSYISDADKKPAGHESLSMLNLQAQGKTLETPNFEIQRMHYARYFKRTIMCYAVFAVSGHFMKHR